MNMKNDAGEVVARCTDSCIGTITDINADGVVFIYNPFANEKTTLDIRELNKKIVDSDYYLRDNFI